MNLRNYLVKVVAEFFLCEMESKEAPSVNGWRRKNQLLTKN